MKKTHFKSLTRFAGAIALIAWFCGTPHALADTNRLCDDNDPSSCFLAINLPPYIIQQYALDPAHASAIRYVKGEWSIKNHVLGNFGFNGWTPVVGDWDGDSYDNIGYFKNGIWVLKKNWNFADHSDVEVHMFGDPTWRPVPGDWNDDGVDSLGLYKNGTFKIQHVRGDASSEHIISFGNLTFDPADALSAWPVVGDFDGTGTRVGIIHNTSAAISKGPNVTATYGFDVGDYTDLSAGTIGSRDPDLSPIVYKGFHPFDNPAYPESKVLFALPPVNKDRCPDTQFCLWLTLSNNGTPNEGGTTDIPDPEIW